MASFHARISPSLFPRRLIQVENQMVSAERVLGYCRVPQEASLESEPGRKPKDDWPAEGAIEVRQGCCGKRREHRGLFLSWLLAFLGAGRPWFLQLHT